MIAVIEPTWYLLLAAMLFGLGAFGLMVRRNPLIMFMCVELMLNAANLTFVALATRLGDINGQTAVFFVMVVAAAEVVVGRGIIVSILPRRPGATADDLAHGTTLFGRGRVVAARLSTDQRGSVPPGTCPLASATNQWEISADETCRVGAQSRKQQ